MCGLRGVGIHGLANPVFSAGCPGGGLMSTILSYNPIAYWPLNELSGTAAINYGSLGTAANGTHTGDTLAQISAPGGGLAPYFDGADYTEIYSAAFAGGFVPTLFTALIWAKVYNIGVMTDGADRFALSIGNGNNNRVSINKSSTNNQHVFLYSGNATADIVSTTDYSNTNWNLFAITIDKTADQMKAYANNTQIGVTQTGLGTFTGAITTQFTDIGWYSGSYKWYGYLSHATVYSSVLTQPQIASIYAAGGV